MFLHRTYMKLLTVFVLFAFTTSIGAPVALAAQAAGDVANPTVQTMVNTSKKGLSLLWFNWSEYIKGLKYKPDRAAAYTFFKNQGATEQQALALTGNAEVSGHLVTKTPTAAQATSGNMVTRWFNKITGAVKGKTTAQASNSRIPDILRPTGSQGVHATVTPTLGDRVRMFFARFKSGSSAASATAGGNSASSSNAVANNASSGVSADAGASADASAGASAGASAATGKPGFFGKIGAGIKKGVDAVWLGTRRAGSTVGGAAKTGYLTLGDKLDFNRYYKIPLTDHTAIKVRGEFKGVTKFTNKGWVVEKYVGKSKTPARLGEQLGQVEMISNQPVSPKTWVGRLFSRFKTSIRNVKNKMTGKGYIRPETRAEINRLKIEGNLLEQARMLNEAQRAIKYRIDHLAGSARSLRRPVPEQEIAALKKQYDAIEVTKKQLARKIDQVHSGPAKTVVANAARWAAYSIGITASVNLIKQAFSGEGIDIKKAFAFLGEPQFWGGTVGGFLGSTLLTSVCSGLFPGAGLFLKVLPGFLGAALGFEFGASLFGGQMDLLGSVVQTLASAGGYTLAASMIGPGFPAILAAIAAGSLASILLNRLRGDPTSNAFVLPPQPIVPDQNAAGNILPAAQVGSTRPAKPSSTSMSLADAQAKVKDAYNRYITYLKARKLADARKAHEEYVQAKKVLESVKTGEMKH